MAGSSSSSSSSSSSTGINSDDDSVVYGSPWVIFAGSVIFMITWVFLAFKVKRVPIGRTLGTMAGAVLVIITRVLDPTEAFAAINIETLALLFGNMIITVLLEKEGFFVHVERVLTWKCVTARQLLIRVSAVSAILSALVTNDTCCVFLTPIVCNLCKREKLPYAPYLLAIATSANIGSTATPVGNPQNMIIATMGGLSYSTFLARLAPATIVCFIMNILLLAYLYRNQLVGLVLHPTTYSFDDDGDDDESSEGTWRKELENAPAATMLRSDSSPAIKRVPRDQVPNDDMTDVEAAVASARDDESHGTDRGDEKRLNIAASIPSSSPSSLLTVQAAAVEAARRQPRPLPPIKQSFRVEATSPMGPTATVADAPNFESYSASSWPKPSSQRTLGASSSSSSSAAVGTRPPKRTPLRLKKPDVRGTLVVTIIEARDLPPLNADGTSDPFCTLKRKGYKAMRSKTITSTLAPKFDSTFTFTNLPSREDLVLTVWDFDAHAGDSRMGSFTFSAYSFDQTGSSFNHQGWFLVNERDAPKAKILLRFVFIADGQAPVTPGGRPSPLMHHDSVSLLAAQVKGMLGADAEGIATPPPTASHLAMPSLSPTNSPAAHRTSGAHFFPTGTSIAAAPSSQSSSPMIGAHRVAQSSPSLSSSSGTPPTRGGQGGRARPPPPPLNLTPNTAELASQALAMTQGSGSDLTTVDTTNAVHAIDITPPPVAAAMAGFTDDTTAAPTTSTSTAPLPPPPPPPTAPAPALRSPRSALASPQSRQRKIGARLRFADNPTPGRDENDSPSSSPATSTRRVSSTSASVEIDGDGDGDGDGSDHGHGGHGGDSERREAPNKRRLQIHCVILTATIISFIAGAPLGWAAVAGCTAMMIVDWREPDHTLLRVDWNLLVFFAALFVVVHGFQQTGLPAGTWAAAKSTIDLRVGSGVFVYTLLILIGSNTVSNVPLVLLLGRDIPKLYHPTGAWLLLSFVSTIAGNLTLVGSVANLIVVERSKRFYGLTFMEYLKFGLPSTVACLLFGVLIVNAMLPDE